MFVFGVILVRIFPHSDWIRRIRLRENTDKKNSGYRRFSRNEWGNNDNVNTKNIRRLNALHKKWSFPLRISSVNLNKPQFVADLVIFTEEINNGKCSAAAYNDAEKYKLFQELAATTKKMPRALNRLALRPWDLKVLGFKVFLI